MRRLKEGKVHLETHSSLETCEEEKEGAHLEEEKGRTS
jgi:hypothetical protein